MSRKKIINVARIEQEFELVLEAKQSLALKLNQSLIKLICFFIRGFILKIFSVPYRSLCVHTEIHFLDHSINK